MILRNTVAEISKSALLANLDTIASIHRTKAGNRKFLCPMVKANAYGHGDVIVSKIIEPHVSHLGVVLLEEGIRLREAGIQKPILVFGHLFDLKSFKLCESFKLTPVLSSLESLNIFLESKIKITVHLKFDTGMTRLGFQEKDLRIVKEKVSQLEVEGVCTHFLNSEDAREEDGYTTRQLKSFSQIESMFQGQFKYSHCLNSAALISELTPQTDFQKTLNAMGARPGLAMYGFSPVKCNYDLKPVMTLKSVIVQKKTIQKDQTVSYGATWKARRETHVAVVGIGYADGYFRSFSNVSEMMIGATEVPLIGRVCMDYCMLDITDHPEKDKIQINDEVIVFGTNIKVDRLASKIQTIPYELLTHVGARVPRQEVL